MGWHSAFDFETPVEIFREYAALVGHRGPVGPGFRHLRPRRPVGCGLRRPGACALADHARAPGRALLCGRSVLSSERQGPASACDRPRAGGAGQPGSAVPAQHRARARPVAHDDAHRAFAAAVEPSGRALSGYAPHGRRAAGPQTRRSGRAHQRSGPRHPAPADHRCGATRAALCADALDRRDRAIRAHRCADPRAHRSGLGPARKQGRRGAGRAVRRRLVRLCHLGQPDGARLRLLGPRPHRGRPPRRIGRHRPRRRAGRASRGRSLASPTPP